MSEGEQSKTGMEAPKAKPVKFIHSRLPSFVSLHSDGAWGTVNNDGLIQLNFFSEQPPVAQYLILPVKPDGGYTGEYVLPAEDQNYFLVNREFQVGVVLNARAARQLRDALNTFIGIAEKHGGNK